MRNTMREPFKEKLHPKPLRSKSPSRPPSNLKKKEEEERKRIKEIKEIKRENKTKPNPKKKRMKTFLNKKDFPTIVKVRLWWRARSLQGCNNKDYMKKSCKSSKRCKKVAWKGHHTIAIASPLPKTRIPIILWPGSCCCYSSSPRSFSLLGHMVARWQSSTAPWRLLLLPDVHHYCLQISWSRSMCTLQRTPRMWTKHNLGTLKSRNL